MTTFPEIHMPMSAREPMVSTYQRDMTGLSASIPGPVYLPGVSMRNPITGRGYMYSNYAWSADRPKISPHNIKEHERSVFTNTNFNSSFYVIHPDWTSEANCLRRIISTDRGHHSWDSRPSVQPLRETSRDTYLPHLSANKANLLHYIPNRPGRNAVNQLNRYSRYHQTNARGMTPAGTQLSQSICYPCRE